MLPHSLDRRVEGPEKNQGGGIWSIDDFRLTNTLPWLIVKNKSVSSLFHSCLWTHISYASIFLWQMYLWTQPLCLKVPHPSSPIIGYFAPEIISRAVPPQFIQVWCFGNLHNNTQNIQHITSYGSYLPVVGCILCLFILFEVSYKQRINSSSRIIFNI